MAQPSEIQKKFMGMAHVMKHKKIPNFEEVDAETDKNYSDATERFLEFHTQLNAIITNTEAFKQKLIDTSNIATQLAENFVHLSQVPEGSRERWAAAAHSSSLILKTRIDESASQAHDLLTTRLEAQFLSELRAGLKAFSDVKKLITDRYRCKVEVQHYSSKVQDLNENPKATDEKKDRNNEKYALANNNLREQTTQLMARFQQSEELRKRVLEEFLPKLTEIQLKTFKAYSDSIGGIASAGDGGGKARSGGGSIGREMSVQGVGGHALNNGSKGDNAAGGYSSYPPTPPNQELRDITTCISSNDGASAAGGSPSRQRSLHGKKLSAGVSAASSQQPAQQQKKGSGSSGGAAPEVQASVPPEQSQAPNRDQSVDEWAAEAQGDSPGDKGAVDTEDRASADGAHDSNDEGVEHREGESNDDVPPGFIEVRALYDYEATQEGDLSFNMHDIIITEQASWTPDGWLLGTCGDRTGLYPSNYTERISTSH